MVPGGHRGSARLLAWGRCSLRSVAVIGALVGAVFAILAVAGTSPARADPPEWWYELTGAGPPLYVPTMNPKPPYEYIGSKDASIQSFFETELEKTTAEIVVLQYDLDLSKHLGSAGLTVLQTLLVALFFAGAPECGFPLALIRYHDYLSKAQDAVQSLNVVQKRLRLNADEQYVAWLDRWYAQFKPNFSKHGTFDSNPRWVHNPNSPFNKWIRSNMQLLKTLKKLRKKAVFRRAVCPPPIPPPPPVKLDCSTDNPSNPPPAGCVRVTVRVIPAPLPSDPGNESVGVGVGSATLEPGGATVRCLNPEDAEACVVSADVPAGEPATVSADPGSVAGYPASPPDSALYKFAGACSGMGACTFTPTSDSSVDVYFMPAMVNLTLQASGDEGHANMTANEFAGGGLEPIPPVYCGFTYPSHPLPCHVQVRVDRSAQVEANSAGDPQITLQSFSSNCSPSSQGPSFCVIRMTSDQTVTATFGATAVG